MYVFRENALGEPVGGLCGSYSAAMGSVDETIMIKLDVSYSLRKDVFIRMIMFVNAF